MPLDSEPPPRAEEWAEEWAEDLEGGTTSDDEKNPVEFFAAARAALSAPMHVASLASSLPMACSCVDLSCCVWLLCKLRSRGGRRRSVRSRGRMHRGVKTREGVKTDGPGGAAAVRQVARPDEIGRASCRERV